MAIAQSNDDESEQVALKPENVREHPKLLRKEKETIIRVPKEGDHAILNSSEGAVMKNAIRLHHVEVKDYDDRDESITSVKATVPVGLLQSVFSHD